MSKPNFHRNRGVGRSGADALTSGRWGVHQGRRTRTYHGNCGAVTKAQPVGRGGSVDYLNRSGAYAGYGEDLVTTGGRSADAMRQILTEVDAATTRANGRVTLTWVQELPVELDQAAWRRIADALAADLEATGRPAHWAIHDDGQPHLHLVAASRPIRDGRVTAEGVRGRPAEESALWVGKAAIQAQRQRACDLVNVELEAADIDYRWFANRDNQMDRPGIVGRAPEKRVPEAAYRRGQRQRDPAAVEAARARHEADRAARARKRQERDQRRQERLAKAVDDLGAIAVANAKLAQLDTITAQARDLRERGKAFAAASARQKELIRTMAGEAGVEVTDLQLAQLDGGDLMAAVKAAKRQGEAAFRARVADAEKRVQDLVRQNALLTAALERERQKAAQAMRKARPEAKSAEPQKAAQAGGEASFSPPSPSKPRGPSW